MPFTIDDRFLPATLAPHPMTDEEFAVLCSQCSDLLFEMTADSEVIVMAPKHSLIGVRNSAIASQLDAWAETDGRGLACGSSAGFVLPNGARRSPDASWTAMSRIKKLPKKIQQGFWHLCPDFVIELRSKSDSMGTVRGKMVEYRENGAKVGWLIDLEARMVEAYYSSRPTEFLFDINSINGEGPVAGFVLDLTKIWNPVRRKPL